MAPTTDWIALWRELQAAQDRSWQREVKQATDGDPWREKARHFAAGIAKRWATPDSSRATVAAWLDAHPGATVLDVGAGTGAWAACFAGHARLVTAVEPSAAMVEVMRETLASAGTANVGIVQAPWPDAPVEPHDVAFCSQAMYGFPDFAAFVRSLERVARRHVFLVMRAPVMDGLMAEVARRVWGHPWDSPNFQVGYNALLQLGIFPDVVMEDTGLWEPWASDSPAAAIAEVKRRFALPEVGEHDAFLADLVQRRLTLVDGQYVWPRGVRSALVHWDVEVHHTSA
jgi:SAM-dependent methyltransferase